MTFKYRLERVLSLREQELDKVKAKFQEAASKIKQIEIKIQQNKQDQINLQTELSKGVSGALMGIYANRANYLRSHQESLEQQLIQAQEQLEIVKQELLEAQQKMEALKKHKKKQKAEYEKSELKKEEIMLNELALTMRRLKEDNNAEQ